jgi:5-methylcytosine-specific restriction protein A
MVIKNRPRSFVTINGDFFNIVLGRKSLAETSEIPAYRAISGRCGTMPISAKKPCSQPGCPALVSRGERYCPDHQRARYQRENRARSEDPERRALDALYNSTRWRKYREWYLREHPLCAECERNGRTAAACIVDHIVPTADGGDFWEESNHQPICDPCHRAKSARETFGRARTRGGPNLDFVDA